jgi:hypothetical protein
LGNFTPLLLGILPPLFSASLKKKHREKEIKYFLGLYSELNIKVNLKINNYVSSTYSFLRNSLITLCFIGILSCGLYALEEKKESGIESKLNKQQNELVNINQNLERIGTNISRNKSDHNLINNKILLMLEDINEVINKTFLKKEQK